MRFVAALVVVAALVAGCGGDDSSGGELSGTCGLPKIRNADPERVAEEFRLDGDELARTRDYPDRFIATINVPYSVTEAYEQYGEQVVDAGWDVFMKETEGFEAELYLTRSDRWASVSILTSVCQKKSRVYVSILDRKALLPSTPTPAVPPNN